MKDSGYDAISIGDGKDFTSDWNARAKKYGALEISSFGTDSYKKFAEFFGYVLAQRIINHLKIDKSDTILDLGCGPGKITKHIIGVCKKIIAVDGSDVMLAEAKKVIYPKSKIQYYQKIEDLSGIKNDMIDKAFSYAVFIHLPEDVQYSYISEIIRVLKPGGIALIHVRYKQKLERYIRTFSGVSFNESRLKNLMKKYPGCEFEFLKLRGDEDLSDLKYRRFLLLKKIRNKKVLKSLIW